MKTSSRIAASSDILRIAPVSRIAHGVRAFVCVGYLIIAAMIYFVLSGSMNTVLEAFLWAGVHQFDILLKHRDSDLRWDEPVYWLNFMLLPFLLLGLYMLTQIWQLFSAYGQGAILQASSCARIWNLGVALLVLAVTQPLARIAYRIGIEVIQSGTHSVTINLEWMDFQSAISGLLLMALAKVLSSASDIAAENRQFV